MLSKKAQITIRLLSDDKYEVCKSGKRYPFGTFQGAFDCAFQLRDQAGGPSKAIIQEVPKGLCEEWRRSFEAELNDALTKGEIEVALDNKPVAIGRIEVVADLVNGGPHICFRFPPAEEAA